MEQSSVSGTPYRLFTELESDSQRLIDIFIGNAERPIKIQQSLLEQVSSYFVGAFCSNGFEEARSGVLRLPEDRVDVWRILTSWIFRHEVPEALLGKDLLLAIRCWVTGDKYDIKDFQDAVMSCMLAELVNEDDDVGAELSLEMVQAAYEGTMPGSVLRNLVMECKYLEYGDDEADYDENTLEELESLDGTGFLPHFARFKAGDETLCLQSSFSDSERSELWNVCMVGSSKTIGMLLPELPEIVAEDTSKKKRRLA